MKHFEVLERSPLTEAEVEAKFRRLVGPRMDNAQSDALLRALWRLEEIDDIRSVLELLQLEHSEHRETDR
jgi:hypothetical protein